MKCNITYTYHYLLFLSLALLLAPTTIIRSETAAKEIKIEKNKQQPLANESTEELLHSEMLFR
jgi:hypothetical protein